MLTSEFVREITLDQAYEWWVAKEKICDVWYVETFGKFCKWLTYENTCAEDKARRCVII